MMMDAPIEMTDEMQRRKIANRRDVLRQIKEELIDRLQLEFTPDDIDDDTFLFGSGLALDSIDAMEIVIGMQARFGVLMPDGDIASLRTINTLADFVLSEQALEAANA
jgi:acyl carrier protein